MNQKIALLIRKIENLSSKIRELKYENKILKEQIEKLKGGKND